MACNTCSKCALATLSDGKEAVYKQEAGIDGIKWYKFDTELKDAVQITDTTDLNTLNAITTFLSGCDGFGGSSSGCTPKSKSETVAINCDSVVGLTDDGDGIYTWTHNLGLTDFANVLFTPHAVIASDANSVTFESEACLGSFSVSILALGAADCAPSGGGGGSVTVDAANGLHIDATTGKVYLGGELVEDTTISLLDKYYNLTGSNADNSDPNNPVPATLSFTKEMNFEEYMAFWNNDDLLRSLTIVEKAQLFKVFASGAGTNGIQNSGEMRIIMEGVRFGLSGEATFEVSNLSGVYKLSNVPLDLINQAEYNVVIKADGTLLKTLNYHQDASVCYSSASSPTNFVFQLPDTAIDKTIIDYLVSGTATDYISRKDYAIFSNTGYTADALYFGYPYIKSAATQLIGLMPNVKLQTLYMPNLTTIAEATCFDTVVGQTITVIIPAALHSDPAILSLVANNTVTLLDSAALSSVVNFKKVISNRSVRYFDGSGVEVTDAVVVSTYENYIRSFAVFATNCSSGGGTSLQPIQEQFTANAGQVSFTLSSNAHSFLGGYVNGVLVPFTAFTVSGTTATYTASANDNHVFVGGERVQIMYNKTI